MRQQKRIFREIVKRMFGNLADKKIAILGFAFKENTNDTRESPSISICKYLMNEGALLSIHDEKVQEETIKRDLSLNDSNSKDFLQQSNNKWNFESNLYCALENADSVIIITEWQSYKEIDWERVSLNVKTPFWIFDIRSILNCDQVRKYGLNIWQLGNGNNV